MTAVRVGYARCSTDKQDLSAQQAALLEPSVDEDRIYLDSGLTGTKRDRPGLDQGCAAVRSGDTLVVPSSTSSLAPQPQIRTHVRRRLAGGDWAAVCCPTAREQCKGWNCSESF